MSGYADIIALWTRVLHQAEGRIGHREMHAMRTLVELTWDALGESGHDMAKLRADVLRLIKEGDSDGTAQDRTAECA